jgi:hypothetical protein
LVLSGAKKPSSPGRARASVFASGPGAFSRSDGASELAEQKRNGIVERQKRISSRESHGHQELSRFNNVHAAFGVKKSR